MLNANYLLAQLDGRAQPSFPGPCMHEVLFDDRFLEGHRRHHARFRQGADRRGLHPMTMYFPLVVHGALLIEPTETESKASLDRFVSTLRGARERGPQRRCRPFYRGAAPDAAPPPRRNRRRAQAGAALASRPDRASGRGIAGLRQSFRLFCRSAAALDVPDQARSIRRTKRRCCRMPDLNKR